MADPLSKLRRAVGLVDKIPHYVELEAATTVNDLGDDFALAIQIAFEVGFETAYSSTNTDNDIAPPQGRGKE